MQVLSEFQGKIRTAIVYYRRDTDDYFCVGYHGGEKHAEHPFPTENRAENWAEDWVLAENWVNLEK